MHRLVRRFGVAPLLLLIPGLCHAASSSDHARRHGPRHATHAARAPAAPIKLAVARPFDADAVRSYPAVWRSSGDDRPPTMVSYGLGPDGLAASFGYRPAPESRPVDRAPFVPSDPRPIGTGSMLGATLSYHFR